MKLIIEDTLVLDDINNPSITDEELDEVAEYYREIQSVANSYGVYCELDLREDSSSLIIYPQKVTLDEIAMNHLFVAVLSEFENNIEYAPLGGKGCDFSISITSK